MKKPVVLRPALTMLEVIFVIVILGIVSSIGAEIIAQVYENYIVQRAEYKAAIKTELALNQITNRLRYAIPSTVGFRTSLTTSFKNITEPNTGNDKVLQWVGYDGDSFEAMTSTSRKPGWSGFCDLDDSAGTTIDTPGSDLALANEIIGKLSNGAKGIADAQIYFPDGSSYGVASGNAETLTLDSTPPSGASIYERYKLAWSSYALEVDSNNNLVLHYNFSPITGAAINGSNSVLLRNVTNFRFKGSEGSLRIKICKEEKIGNSSIHACKEKVIF